MAFPSTPTNGQIAIVGGIAYQYASTPNSWSRILSSANVITANSISANFVSANTFNINNAFTVPSLSTTGNITGNYFIGNGSQLTGIAGGGGASIANGASNISLASSGGNAAVSIGGTANVAVFAATGQFVTGVVSASGNITGGNLLTGGLISSTGTITGSSHLGSVVSVTGNITGGLISAVGNVTGGNVVTGGLISATGNVSSGASINTTNLSVSGNVLGNLLPSANITYNLGSPTQRWNTLYLAGNTIELGAQSISTTAAGLSVGNNPVVTVSQTGTSNTTGNMNVVGNVTGSNVVSTGLILATGNITGGNILTGGLISATGNVTAGNVSATNFTGLASSATVAASANSVAGANVTGAVAFATTANAVAGANVSGQVANALVAGTVYTAAQPNITSVGTLTSLAVTGNATANNGMFTTIVNTASHTGAVVSVTGNVTGSYFIGNGSQLTGVTAGAPTSVVNGTSNVVVASSGNVTVGVAGTPNVAVFATTGEYVTGLISATGNITANNGMFTNIVNVASHTGAVVSVSGNITGGNVSGTLLTGTLATAAQTNITSVGTLGALAVSGNITGVNVITSQINSGSVLFNGTSQNLTVPSNAAFTYGTGDFTVEFWLYITVAGNVYQQMYVQPRTGTNLTIRFGDNGFGNLLQVSLDSATLGSVWNANITQASVVGSWKHIAFTRSGSTCRLFVNGVLQSLGSGANPGSFPVTSFTDATNITLPTSASVIGSGVTGYISNFRVVNGVAVYTSAFTPATAPLTSTQSANQNGIPSAAITGTSTALLLNTPSGGGFLTDSSTNNFTVTNNGSATSNALTPFASIGGNVTAAYGIFATSVNTASFTGAVVSVTGNVTANNGMFTTIVNTASHTGAVVSVTGNITGGNVSGTLLTGTLATAAQTNITSVGTLGALAVSGNVTAGSGVSVPSGSVLFNGTTQVLTVPDNAVFEMSGDFTVEFWFYLTATPTGFRTVISKGAAGVFQPYYFTFNASTTLLFYSSSTGTSWDIASAVSLGSVSLNTWNTAAVSRVGTAMRLFLNGALVTTITNGSALYDNTSAVGIGGRSDVSELFAGYVSTVRIVKGTGVYTSAFTPATAPLTSTQSANQNGNPSAAITGTSTSLLLNTVNGAAFLTDSSTNNFTVTNTGTATSNSLTPFVNTSGTVTSTFGIFTTSVNTASFTGAVVSVTGNVTANNGMFTTIVNTASHTGAVVSVTGNVTGGNIISAGVISATSNAAGAGVQTVTIADSSTVAGAGKAFGLQSGTNNLAIIGNITNGSYNGFQPTGDIALLASGSSVGNVGFSIIPWSGLNAGIRIAAVSNVSTITITANTIAIGGPITNLQGNAVGNIGNATGYFNRLFAQATTALYADLAEVYKADAEYPPGTVLIFGGSQEVTISTQSHDARIAGVVSTNPAHVMNSGLVSEYTVDVGLIGRVPCQVIGPVAAGDRVVSSNRAGVAERLDMQHYQPGVIIGKAVESYNGTGVGTIEIVVGRL